jgi:hypothetical protein
MIAGLLLFGRYAYAPNRLGYCGPADHQSLFGYLTEGRVDTGLAQLARRFDGAYPYLLLIARANRLDDPFDPRVVEAYWIGNALLERVGAAPFFESLKARFLPRMKARDFCGTPGPPSRWNAWTSAASAGGKSSLRRAPRSSSNGPRSCCGTES